TIGPASGLATPVSATSTGSTLITATYGSLNNNTTLTVGLAPTITSGNSATFFEGVAGSVTVTTTGIPTPSLSENGSLPSGVSFTDNHDGTATLAGTPAVGTSASSPYSLTINASNGIGPNASQPFSLTVQVEYAIAVPTTTTLVSSLNPSFTAAPDNSVQFTATVTSGGNPVSSGTVTFTDNGNPLSGCSAVALNGSGQAQCTYSSFTTEGIHP